MKNKLFSIKYLFTFLKFEFFGKKECIDNILVKGNRKFVKQVIKALKLIKDNSPEEYAIINNNLGRITQGIRSHIYVQSKPSIFLLTEKSAFHSLTWCSQCIAHDAFHSKLYNSGESTYDKSYEGKVKEELLCNDFAIKVMQNISAPQEEIEYLKEQKGEHFDVDKDGKYDWKDIEAQDW